MGFWRARAYGLWEKKPIWLLPLHLLWSSTCSSKGKKKRKLVWKFKASRLGNYPINYLFVMLCKENPNYSINVFLGWFEWGFVVCFVLVGNF